MGIFPTDGRNKVESGFTHLQDPNYAPITIKRLEGDDALPNGQKPFTLEIQSPSQDFMFMPDVVRACPKLGANLASLKTTYNSGLRNHMIRLDKEIKTTKN